jgi:hypothetical protein
MQIQNKDHCCPDGKIPKHPNYGKICFGVTVWIKEIARNPWSERQIPKLLFVGSQCVDTQQ